jgi:hypothetical protein
MKTEDTRQPSLTLAVIDQIGDIESLPDVARHGADAGYAGLTYYTDTVEFAAKNRTVILARLKEDAANLGYEGVISMLASFNCFKGMTQEEIAEGLYDENSEHRTTVYNGLAWYAAEEIARELNPDI